MASPWNVKRKGGGSPESIYDEIIRSKRVYRMQTQFLGHSVFEREMCPWAISISILVIRCPTHIE
jgi:hypothetical protein